MSDDHTWEWHSLKGLPYLTCSLLADFQHGFFTRQFHPRKPEVLVKTFHPSVPAYRVKQVHGNKVVFPGDIEAAEREVEADGIVTQKPQESVWAATADCTPVLIGDPVTGRVAAVHAGWRGTAQKIVLETIARLQASGSSLDNLCVAIGPAIDGQVYQVGERVAAEVATTILPQDSSDVKKILTALRQIPNSPILHDSEPGRVRLDVRRVNQLQLEKAGMVAARIAIAPYCTYQQPEYFFSYRRRREKKVQWSGIIGN